MKVKTLFPLPRKLLKLETDDLLLWVLILLGAIAGAIILAIIAFLGIEALPVLQQVGIWRFFSDPSWNPASGSYNLTPMLWGTLLVTGGAVAIAAPIGILSAIFSHYYAPNWLATWYRRLIELLAGIPSVVYGFWGLVVLVPIINRLHPPGTSLLAGIVVLTIMILPTMTLVAEASFTEIPPEYLLGAASLGLSRWGTVWQIVLPTARSGLLAGLILQMGRAIGETMAVLMVCGNVVQVPDSLFAPMRTLTANIALEMAYALGNHRSALFVSGLALMAIVICLVIVTEVVSHPKIYD